MQLVLIVCTIQVPHVDEGLEPQMSHVMRKTTFCICEHKGADVLRSNCEADQRLCFRYTDSTAPLLSESKISHLEPSSVFVQHGLCQTCSETTLGYSRRGSNVQCQLSLSTK